MLPFVGSEIGLISNSDIRFQGILHSINPNDSTVALEQVKSFGTEDRRKDRIPPSDQIFSYIVFKGADIKDLYVISGPKENSNWNQNFNGLPPGMNPYYAQQAMAFHQQQQQQYWQQQQNLGYNMGMMDHNPMINSTIPVSNNNIPQVNVQEKTSKPELDIYQGHAQVKNQQNLIPKNERNEKNDLQEGSLWKNKQKNFDKGKEKREINVTLSKNSNGKNTVTFDLPEKPKVGETKGNEKKKSSKMVIPDSEFDFASSNAKFNKSQGQEEMTGSVFYQKSSFFDDISCEVKDRSSGAVDRRQRIAEEKSQNLETFGTTGSRFRGRGRGRGRGRSYNQNQNGVVNGS